ncbi:MAG: CapA family protein [Haloarculaceae archaeon]
MGLTRRAVLGAGFAAAVGTHGTVAAPWGRECRPTVPGDVDATVGFVGDVMLGRGVNERWRRRSPGGVWDGLRERLDGLDGLVCNLECSLSDRGDRRPGGGYFFRADPGWAIPALSVANTSFASLANNHQLDFGPVALRDTLASLEREGIAHAGAGFDRAAAFAPAVTTIGDLRAGFVALTDRAPTDAAEAAERASDTSGETAGTSGGTAGTSGGTAGTSGGTAGGSPGTAYVAMDPRNARTRRLVGRALGELARRDPDLVVASLHWGPNWEERPTRTRRLFARWLIDRGVDVVHGHSAHVLQGVETYCGRPIVYDAGDFVDDYLDKPSLPNKYGALFELAIADGRFEGVRAVPTRIESETVRPARGADAALVRERLRSLSTELGTTVEREPGGRGVWIPLADG